MSDPADDEENDLDELIREKGECVCSIYWNFLSGHGESVSEFYKFKNEYWQYGVDGLLGPAESLVDAMEGFGIPNVAVDSIDCTELTAAEIAKRFGVHDALPGDRVEINGEWWEVSPDRKLERARG